MGTVGLTKELSLLRQELAQAQDAGQGHQFRFEITEGGAGVGARFGVASVKVGGSVSRADTHRLKLKLNIKDTATGGRNLEVHKDETRSWDK